MKKRLLIFAFVVIAAFIFGFGRPSVSHAQACPSTFYEACGSSCMTNDDCLAGNCLDPAGCGTNAYSDSNCSVSCNPSNGGGNCTTDSGCAGGQVCNTNSDGVTCSCASASPAGNCYTGVGCTCAVASPQIGSCLSNNANSSGVGNSCSSDSGCAGGQVCNASTGGSSCNLSSCSNCIDQPTCCSAGCGWYGSSGCLAPGLPSTNQCSGGGSCTDSSQCTSETQPICGSSGTCVGCSSNSQCAAAYSNAPYCNTNTGECVTTSPTSCSGDSSVFVRARRHLSASIIYALHVAVIVSAPLHIVMLPTAILLPVNVLRPRRAAVALIAPNARSRPSPSALIMHALGVAATVSAPLHTVTPPTAILLPVNVLQHRLLAPAAARVAP